MNFDSKNRTLQEKLTVFSRGRKWLLVGVIRRSKRMRVRDIRIPLSILHYFVACFPSRQKVHKSLLLFRISIPANFLSVKWLRFFVSTESEFPKIYRQLLKIAKDFERLPKNTEGFQWLLKIFRQHPTITEDVDRFLMTSKQGRQRFPTNFEHY